MAVDFDALSQTLFATCDERLGDAITIRTPAGPVVPLRAHVDHSDARQDFGLSAATVQDASLDIAVDAVTGKPGKGWRVTLAKLPGKTFEPINVRRDTSGLRWVFELKELKGA